MCLCGTDCLSGYSRTNLHKDNNLKPCGNNITEIISVFKKRIVSYRVEPWSYTVNIRQFLSSVKSDVITLVKYALREDAAIKMNVELFGEFALPKKTPDDAGDGELVEIKSFKNSRLYT